MALSHRATTTAILRGILGPFNGQETRFAELAGRSVSWVKKVSSGHEPLTEEAALALESSTGISAAWLLLCNIAAPPVGIDGKPYSFAVFEQHRANLKEGSVPNHAFALPSDALPAIAAIGAAAGGQGKGTLFNYRLTRFLDESRKEFGFNETAMAAFGDRSVVPTPEPPPAPKVAPRNSGKRNAVRSTRRVPESDDTSLPTHLL